MNQKILKLHEDLGPKRSFLLRLEDFNVSTFVYLYDWLGFRHCVPTRLIHDNKYGWTPERAKGAARVKLSAGCHFAKTVDDPH